MSNLSSDYNIHDLGYVLMSSLILGQKFNLHRPYLIHSLNTPFYELLILSRFFVEVVHHEGEVFLMVGSPCRGRGESFPVEFPFDVGV